MGFVCSLLTILSLIEGWLKVLGVLASVIFKWFDYLNGSKFTFPSRIIYSFFTNRTGYLSLVRWHFIDNDCPKERRKAVPWDCQLDSSPKVPILPCTVRSCMMTV